MKETQNTETVTGTTLPEQNTKAQLVRFDKNLASNGLDFTNSFGDDGQLIFDVLFYMAVTYQKDLFGYGNFDPVKFCEEMGHNRLNLLKKHPKPAQISQSNQLKKELTLMEKSGNYNQKLSNGEFPFYSVLDNALYRAGKENLKFSYEVKNFESKENIQGMHFVQLLSDVNKHYADNHRNKIRYTYKMSTTIESHLSKYFMLANPEAVKKLRKKNSVFLYFYLKNLQQTLRYKGERFATPNFDTICKIAEINIAEPKDRKKKLIKKLNDLLIETDLKYNFKFVQGTGRFEYNLVIEFLENMKALSPEESGEHLNKAFVNNYFHGIKDFFLANVHKKLEIRWPDWKNNNNYHLKEKIDIFLREYNKMFKPISANSKTLLDYYQIKKAPM